MWENSSHRTDKCMHTSIWKPQLELADTLFFSAVSREINSISVITRVINV